VCHELFKNGPLHRRIGICTNLKYFGELDSWVIGKLVQHYTQNWPFHSGEEDYPMPGGADLYFLLDDKWEGEHGELRYDLLRYLIEETEKDLVAIELEGLG